MKSVIVFLIGLLLTGCAANGFVKYYQDRTGGADLTKAPVIFPTGDPKLFAGGNPDADAQRMLENGYVLIGISTFNGANVNMNDALVQAKSVKAELVLTYSQHTGTRTGVLPLTLPNTQTSTTNLSGNISGSGGYRSFYGNANTTTYGTQTTYMPYSVERYDYLAAYWLKRKPPAFGVHVRALPPELRQQIASNKGVLVNAVVNNSPAFRCDILKGDVLRKIGDVEIYDSNSFGQAVNRFAGQKVTVEIFRDGKELQKEVQLDSTQ